MQIFLSQIPTVYINLDKHLSRRNHIDSMLKQYKFEKVTRLPATYNPIGFLGLLESQIEAIESAKAPFLMLEDDVVIKDFRDQISIPENADAVYLGTSAWALQGSKTTHFLRFQKSSISGVLRIRNMLSSHAILFVSEEFRLECLATLKGNLIGEQLPCDVVLAKMQKNKHIYCLNKPIFIQGDFGEAMSDAPMWTSKKLTKYPKSFQIGNFSIPLNQAAFLSKIRALF